MQFCVRFVVVVFHLFYCIFNLARSFSIGFRTESSAHRTLLHLEQVEQNNDLRRITGKIVRAKTVTAL